MKIVDPSYIILRCPSAEECLGAIERVGRVCYKSESKITPTSSHGFVRMLIERGHEAMLEHGPPLSVLFTTDRGVSHELVRHRLASFAQESTRYCNYSSNRFGNELTFVNPRFWSKGSPLHNLWLDAMRTSEQAYMLALSGGAKPEEARSLLPNSLKTEIVVTANLREWRHIFKLRTALTAHPQMRELMAPLLLETKRRIPVLFDDINSPLESLFTPPTT